MHKGHTLLRKAQQYLRSSAVLLETGDFDSTASRAYFAMFYAAQALLMNRNASLPSGSGIRRAFVEQFVENGPLPDRAKEALNRGYELQEVGDYSQEFVVSERDAEQLLSEAEAFVNSIAGMLPSSRTGEQPSRAPTSTSTQ